MIKLFDSGDRDFASNGELVVLPYKAVVTCVDGGDFFLELEADAQYAAHLVAHRLLVASLPTGQQAFRITNTERSHDRVTVKARHVFYDLEHYLVKTIAGGAYTCAQALERIVASARTNPAAAGADYTIGFQFDADQDAQTASVDFARQPLSESIMTLADTWGWHVVRDNFCVGIRRSVGEDRDLVIRYGRDLRQIQVAESWDDVVTTLLPVGKDDLMLGSGWSDAARYMISAKQYELPYMKAVSFTQDIDKKDYKDAQGKEDEALYLEALRRDLRQQAEKYLKAHETPLVNYTITARVGEPVALGDTIRVIDERLDLLLETDVLSFKYDCLTESYSEVQFGNTKRRLAELRRLVR